MWEEGESSPSFLPSFLNSSLHHPSSLLGGFYSVRSPGFPVSLWRQHGAFKGVGSCFGFLSSPPPSIYWSLSLCLSPSRSPSPLLPFVFLSIWMKPSSPLSSVSIIIHSLSLFLTHFRCLSPSPQWNITLLFEVQSLSSISLSLHPTICWSLTSNRSCFCLFFNVWAVTPSAMFAVLLWPRPGFPVSFFSLLLAWINNSNAGSRRHTDDACYCWILFFGARASICGI